MKEMKVREYGAWTSCNYIKWSGRRLRGEDGGDDQINVQCKTYSELSQ
jgi:hypothetical protein